MSVRRDKVELIVTVNGNQARKEYNALDKEAREIRQSMKDLKKDTAEWIKSNDRLKEIEGKMGKLRKEIGLTGMTMKELRSESRRLIAIRDNMTPGTKAFTQMNQRINEVHKRMAQLRGASTGVKGAFDRLKRSVGQVGMALGIAGGALAFVRGIKSALDTIMEFQQANARLASILGKTRSEIRELTKDAMRLGRSTVFTATEVANLQTEFAKLGFTSGEIRDATEATLGLAAATQSDLAEAASIAGATVRGFGLDASETQRVVDVMAKSFSKSALDLEKFKTAMATVAPVAKTFGFSLEETTSLIAQLSDAGFDASMAGTSLRNILLNLADSNGALAKRLGGSVKSFDELIPALVKLRGEGVDLNETLQLTDKRSVAAFNRFLDGAESAKILKEELDNAAGAAEKMAKEQMDTLRGDITRLSSAWDGFILKLENGEGVLGRLLRGIVRMATAIVDNLPAIGKAIATVTAGIIGYKAAALAAFIQTNLWSGSLKGSLMRSLVLARGAVRSLWITIAANPLGAILAVVGAVTTALVLYRKKIDDTVRAQRALADADRQALINITEQKVRVESLLRVARDQNIALEKRQRAVEELNKISPEYLGNLTLEKINTDEARKAVDNYTESILRQAKMQARKEKLVELEKELIEAQEDFSKSSPTLWQQSVNALKNMGNVQGKILDDLETAIDNREKKIGSIQSQIDAMVKGIQELEITTPTAEDPETPGGGGEEEDDGPLNTIERVTKKIKELQEELAKTPPGVLMETLKRQLKDLEAELAKITAGGAEKAVAERLAAVDLTETVDTDAVDQFLKGIDREMQVLIGDGEIFEQVYKDAQDRLESMGVAGKEHFDQMQEAMNKAKAAWDDLQNAAVSYGSAAIEAGFAVIASADKEEDAMKKFLNVLRDAIAGLLAKAVMAVLAETAITTGPAAIIAAPLLAKLAEVAFKAAVPEFYAGGPTGPPVGRGIDGKGGFPATLHPNEYVIPDWLMEQPMVADFAGMLEGMRQQRSFATGGPTSGPSQPGTPVNVNMPDGIMKEATARRIEAVLDRLAQMLENPRPSIAVVPDQTMHDIMDRIDLLEQLAAESRF